MRMNVPSEQGGARTLPAELRVPQHIPSGHAWGWNRLHQNLTPVSETALSGLADTAMIPVDVPMPPTYAIPPYSGGGMPTYIQSLISQGLVTPTIPGKPPNAPPGARLQHTPWGYMWAHIVKTQTGPVVMWMSERPDVLKAQGVNGLGSCVDPSAWDYDPADCGAPTDTSGGVYESPYPVVFSDGSTGTMTAAQWAALINSSSNALTRTLAITQGGSVSASGNIYGSPGTASIAAGFPQNQLQIGGAGVSGILSSPLLLMLLAGGVLLMMGGRR